MCLGVGREHSLSGALVVHWGYWILVLGGRERWNELHDVSGQTWYGGGDWGIMHEPLWTYYGTVNDNFSRLFIGLTQLPSLAPDDDIRLGCKYTSSKPAEERES